jgi:hypothetical protein
MIRESDKQVVIGILDSILGIGTSLQGGDVSYHCPFCHHYKKKLIVNVVNQKIHCWVCNAKGRNLKSFGKRIGMSSAELSTLSRIYSDDDYTLTPIGQEERTILKLPQEFKKLAIRPKSINPIYSNAINYLHSRGVNIDSIIKWNIGYCETGLYANRIVVPSYDSNGELNFFVTRLISDDDTAFMRYKLAPVNRDIIVFENQINWEQPITLVEGVFDAFPVRRNVIPLLSKNILPTLRDKILVEKPPLINICLDSDAVNESVSLAKFFMDNGIKVKNIIPETKDIGDMNFVDVVKLINDSSLTDWSDLIKSKLKLI